MWRIHVVVHLIIYGNYQERVERYCVNIGSSSIKLETLLELNDHLNLAEAEEHDDMYDVV